MKIKIVFFVAVIMIFFNSFCVFSTEPPETYGFDEIFKKHGAVMLLIEPLTGDIVYANNAASAFYGYSIDQLHDMKITQINTLTPQETAREMMLAADEERNYFNFKHRLSNGDIKDVEVFSYPVIFNEREVLFSIIHDVTTKVLLEQRQKMTTDLVIIAAFTGIFVLLLFLFFFAKNHKRLKEAKLEIDNKSQQMEAFFDAADSLMYLKDENLKYVFVNKSLEIFYNLNKHDIIGKEDFDLTDHSFAQKRRDTDIAVINNASLVNDEVEWNKRIFKTTKFPVRMRNGKSGIGAYIKDITETKLNERRLEKILGRYSILLEVFTKSYESKQQQLDHVLNEALSLTDSKYGYIYLYDEDTQEFTLNSWTNGVLDDCSVTNPETKYQLDKTGAWGEVVRQRRFIIDNDFRSPGPTKKGYPKGHVIIDRFMSAPVIIDGRIVAVIGMANKEEDYTEQDVYEITLLMGGVWHAVERRQTQEQLIYERNKYLQTLVSIGDGVMVVNSHGHIEMLNKVAEEMTGWTIKEAAGLHYTDVFMLSHEKAGMEIKDPIKEVFKTGETQELENHALLTSRTGVVYCLEDSAAPIKNLSNELIGVVLVFRDATEKRTWQKKIEYLSFHDSLTGLYNRRFFEEEMHRLDVSRNLPVSLVMGDVDGLKITNDVFGHSEGDKLLTGISDVFRKVCRADDIIARWGGDEFVLLLPKTDQEQARKIVSRIKQEFEKIEFKAIRGSIALGISSKTNESEDISQVLIAAEENMYHSKTVDKDKVSGNAIETIITSLFKKSNKEKAHAKNVSELSERVARQLLLRPDEIKRIKDAAYYHDIGKVVLSEENLNKNFELSQEEWNEIRKHPIAGFRILNAFEKTIDIAVDVLQHQERWDGSGYPKGIKGEEISLAARIIGMVETYERIRQADNQDPVEFIGRNAGVLFDPVLTKIFVDILNEQE